MSPAELTALAEWLETESALDVIDDLGDSAEAHRCAARVVRAMWKLGELAKAPQKYGRAIVISYDPTCVEPERSWHVTHNGRTSPGATLVEAIESYKESA